MKNLFITVLILVSFFSCKAQQNIVPIYNETGEIDNTYDSDYYKDVDNDLNPYVGIWKWEEGNSSLEIIFNKITHFDEENGDASDLLVGEYKYIENGTVLVNSYDPLMQNIPGEVPNIISSNNSIIFYRLRIENKGFPPCPECSPDTRFLFLGIEEKTKPGVSGLIRMARFIEGSNEKIRMRITNTYSFSPNSLSIPENSIWTLTKIE